MRKTARSALLLSSAALIAVASNPTYAEEADKKEDKSGEIVLAQGSTAPEQPATTEKKIEKVVVTATKRKTAIQDVPFSVNAQTQRDMERTGSTTLEDVSRNVAGASIQNLGPGHSQVSLRGVSAGQIVRDQPGVKEQVGVYLDESIVSLSLFTPDFDLFDLNRVEILRGPQGTLFGSGSIGGTIRYITNQPELDSYSGVLEGNFHNVTDGENGGHVKGMVNMPLSDSTSLRVVGYHTEYAGFIDALREGAPTTPDVNNGERSGVRAALAMQLSPNFLVTPRIVYQSLHMNGFNRQEVWNLFANPDTTTRPPVTFDERQQFLLLDEEFSDETTLGDLTAEWDMGAVALTSITSLMNRSILASRDASALTGSVTISPLSACCGVPADAALMPSNLRDTTDLEQFTQEVRLASDYESSFQWLAGFFYSDIKRDYAQRLPTPGYDLLIDTFLGAGTSAAVDNGFGLADQPYKADVPYDINQWALFGEASLDLTDRLTLTAGGRYHDYEESRRFHSGGLFSNGDDETGSTTSTGWDHRFIATYAVSDDVKVNLQASSGFRPGGINDPLNIPICTPADAIIFGAFPKNYRDETAENYEAGIKMARDSFSINAAIYHIQITDLQVSFDAGSCSSRLVGNADAHTTGGEVEFGWAPTDQLQFTFAGSLLEAEFDETVPVAPGVEEGNRIPSVPEFQLAVGGVYSFPLRMFGEGREGFIAASAQHIGSRFTQPGDQVPGGGTFAHNLGPFGGMTGVPGAPVEITTLDLELDPYTLVNLNVGVESADWAVMLYANNLFDENANLSFNRERGGRARLAFHTNQPRTVGITVRTGF
jgi:outer membrane receptor protein involved in Fe transport